MPFDRLIPRRVSLINMQVSYRQLGLIVSGLEILQPDDDREDFARAELLEQLTGQLDQSCGQISIPPMEAA
jgi:hypothetical protein